jgi:hypothetical protein
MNKPQLYSMADARHTACPHCNKRPTLSRNDSPYFDECGFESYDFSCSTCGASLTGIVDPFDGALLISERPLDAKPGGARATAVRSAFRSSRRARRCPEPSGAMKQSPLLRLRLQ